MDRSAEMVLHNGQVYSIDSQDNLSVSEAVAIQGGKFLWMGLEKDMSQYVDPKTKVIDLQGKTVLPGLTDSHLHASKTAELMLDVSLHGADVGPHMDRAQKIAQYTGELGRKMEALPPLPIIRGVGWDPALFIGEPQGQPTAKDLDKLHSSVPVILRSYDHHYLWVNSKAMELAGIDKNTPTPRNGVVERDKEGNPTGIFQETTAMDLVLNHLPQGDYSVEEYKEGIREYQRKFANPYGTTLIFDALNSENGIAAYVELAKAGELTIRVKTCFYADPSLPFSQFDQMISQKGKYREEDIFDVKTVKFFIDGSGLSFYMNEPFEKPFLEKIGLPSDYRGYGQWELVELQDAFLKLDSAGFQIHTHCMGDAAVRLALDAFEYVSNTNDIKSNRHTIAHLMLIDKSDMMRMSRMGIIGAVQPMWAIYDSFDQQQAVALLGEDRDFRQYPLGAMKKQGCILTSGTDFPITMPPHPFVGIQTGMTRTVPKIHPDYEGFKDTSLGPEENLVSLEDMVSSYTIWGAYQCFLEDVTGSIAPGKSADFVVLDRRLTDVKSNEIEDIKVEATYFKGKMVYVRED